MLFYRKMSCTLFLFFLKKKKSLLWILFIYLLIFIDQEERSCALLFEIHFWSRLWAALAPLSSGSRRAVTLASCPPWPREPTGSSRRGRVRNIPQFCPAPIRFRLTMLLQSVDGSLSSKILRAIKPASHVEDSYDLDRSSQH